MACVALETITSLLYNGWLLSTQSVSFVLSPAARSLGTIFIAAAAFIDLAIAVSMVLLLRKGMIDGMTQTQKIVTHLIIYSVNTGLWTALLAISTAVTMIFFPTSFVYVALSFPMSSLYANTLLANLNVRHHVRGMFSDVVELSLGARTMNPTSAMDFGPQDDSIAVNTAGNEMFRSTVINLDGTRGETIGSNKRGLNDRIDV